MKERLDIDAILVANPVELNDAIIYLEYVENILRLAWKFVMNDELSAIYSEYDVLKKNILGILDKLNHSSHYFDEEEMVYICEKSAVATAVADIVPVGLAMQVIEYNHFLMKGDLEGKRSILLALANKVEPKRGMLEKTNRQLSSNLFYLLNNLDIRHNNREKTSKSYKEYVGKMRTQTLEKWYDETYQLALLALLLLENEKRNGKIDTLKRNMEKTAK